MSKLDTSVSTKSSRFYFFWKKAREVISSQDIQCICEDPYERAFYLWDGDKKFAQEYLSFCRARSWPEKIREISRKLGILELGNDNLREALFWFNCNAQAYASLGYGDKYIYDEHIQRELKKYDAIPKHYENKSSKRKPRIAVLLFGAEHSDSVLVRLCIDFAVNFCAEQIQDCFFSSAPKSRSRIMNESLFMKNGAKLVCSDSEDHIESILFVVEQLKDFAPDVIISIAVLADYKNYLITTRFPSVVHLVLTYGPPEQYIPFDADFVIAPDESLLLDSPVDGAVVPLQFGFPNIPSFEVSSLRSKLGVPNNGVIIISAGRECKFSNIDFLENILSFLEQNPDVYFFGVGLANFPIDFISTHANQSGLARMKAIAWNSEYLQYLSIGDIYLDTFPSGGGLTLIDAMSLGIPVVTFDNYLDNRFTQTNWRPGKYYVPNSFLVLRPNDWVGFKQRLSVLSSDEELRRLYGESCRSHVQDNLSNPNQMVSQVESIALSLLRQL